MLNTKGFYDYNIPEECLANNKYKTVVKLLYDFGYRTIAINQVIDCDNLEPKKKRKKKGDILEIVDPVPTPYEATTTPGCEDMKILNRLTVKFSNSDSLHKIVKSQNYKSYQIIAALPVTPAATAFTVSNLEADIFCIDPESRTILTRNRKTLNQLIERGYHFEISYSAAIEDSTKRKNIIHAAHLYHALAKSRNIIITSGATNYMLLRGPYDILNLGIIFGLNELQAKSAITTCGRQVYLNSVSRRHGKALFFQTDPVEQPDLPKAVPNIEIINLDDSDEQTRIEEPFSKKIKQ